MPILSKVGNSWAKPRKPWKIDTSHVRRNHWLRSRRYVKCSNKSPRVPITECRICRQCVDVALLWCPYILEYLYLNILYSECGYPLVIIVWNTIPEQLFLSSLSPLLKTVQRFPRSETNTWKHGDRFKDLLGKKEIIDFPDSTGRTFRVLTVAMQLRLIRVSYITVQHFLQSCPLEWWLSLDWWRVRYWRG